MYNNYPTDAELIAMAAIFETSDIGAPIWKPLLTKKGT
jgi:hypothetical protein